MTDPEPYQPTHGTASTYNNWGCRCDLCRAASAAYARELRARRVAQLQTTQK